MALTDADRLQIVSMALMRHSVIKTSESLIDYFKKYSPIDYLEILSSNFVVSEDATGSQSYIESSEYSATYTASKAFDDSGSTYWRAASTASGEYIGVDFGTGNEKIIRLIAITYYSGYGMSNIIIQASNDRLSWTDLLTTTSTYNSSSKQYFSFENSIKYRYYRIYNNSPATGASIRVYEIEMMEVI